MNIGTIRMAGRNVANYVRGTEVWLRCDGQNVLQATYPALFALIGATYGAAPAGQFKLPNYTGRIPVGTSPTGYALAATAGTTTHKHLWPAASGVSHIPNTVNTLGPLNTVNLNIPVNGANPYTPNGHTHGFGPISPHGLGFGGQGTDLSAQVSPFLAVGFYIRGL